MRIEVFSIFPELVSQFCAGALVGKAQERSLLTVLTHDLREHTTDVHRTVDDTPFGGGAGMVLRAEPIVRTVEAHPDLPRPLLALTPSGRSFTQAQARELADGEGFSLLCGRYEGFDQRALDLVVDDEISLGDFVLAGGELAALCVLEAVVRLRPGALGNDASSVEESFSEGLLEYPQYTKPAEFRGLEVPAVLRSGDHGAVARWRRAQALARTLQRRPDLITARGGLTDEERQLLASHGLEGPEPNR